MCDLPPPWILMFLTTDRGDSGVRNYTTSGFSKVKSHSVWLYSRRIPLKVCLRIKENMAKVNQRTESECDKVLMTTILIIALYFQL